MPTILSKRDGELMRILASVTVVVAHCVHVWVEQFAVHTEMASLGFVAALLDQFSRFTLPVFFFLSGFGLTLQTFDRPITLGRYYRFRMLKIFAPFLLWTAITGFRHLLWIESWNWSSQPIQTFGKLLWFMFIEGFDYQYYFLIVIFQFYLIFPFVYRLGRYRWAGLAALLVHFTVTSPIETYLEIFNRKLPHIHSNALILHFFWCFMGVYVAWNRETLARWTQKWTVQGATLFWFSGFLLLIVEFLFKLRQGKILSDIDHFNRWSVVVYGLGCFLLFLKVKPWLTLHVIRHPRWQFLFTHVAPYTFFVYLVHTHILRFVDYFSFEASISDFCFRIAWVVFGSYGLAWLAQWLLEDYPKIRFALGLPKQVFKLREAPGIQRLWRNWVGESKPSTPSSPNWIYSREET